MKHFLLTFVCAALALSAFGQKSPNIIDSKGGLSYRAFTRTVSSTSYTVQDEDHTVLVNASGGPVTINLPADSPRAFRLVVIKKIDSGSNEVTIDAAGSQTIDGNLTYTLARQYQSVVLQSNSTAWDVLSRESADGVLRKLYLGTPRATEAARGVASANMKVGAYTIANQPDVARNVSITHTAVSTVDTLGTVIFVGTDYNGAALTETLTPVNGTLVSGVKAFKTVTSITGAGWAAMSTADTITAGYGGLIGLPVNLTASTGTVLGNLDTTVSIMNTTGGTLATSTVTNASTDGSKKLTIYLDK